MENENYFFVFNTLFLKYSLGTSAVFPFHLTICFLNHPTDFLYIHMWQEVGFILIKVIARRLSKITYAVGVNSTAWQESNDRDRSNTLFVPELSHIVGNQ